jgi:hypothetical protein
MATKTLPPVPPPTCGTGRKSYKTRLPVATPALNRTLSAPRSISPGGLALAMLLARAIVALANLGRALG